jgi:hypothetical protein
MEYQNRKLHGGSGALKARELYRSTASPTEFCRPVPEFHLKIRTGRKKVSKRRYLPLKYPQIKQNRLEK